MGGAALAAFVHNTPLSRRPTATVWLGGVGCVVCVVVAWHAVYLLFLSSVMAWVVLVVWYVWRWPGTRFICFF